MITQTTALTASWERLRYHPVQSQLWNHTGQFAAVVAGRQSGKTEICQRKLVTQLPLKKEWPDPIYYYILPTFSQARRVAWYRMLNLIPRKWIAKNGANKNENCITTVFGSKLYILGADKPMRIEGTPADFIMIDESSDQRPGLFDLTIMPMLGFRNGRCYRLGVPKRGGVGREEFRDFFVRGMNGEDGIQSFFWKTSEVWEQHKIDVAKSQLSETDYSEQYDAEWLTLGGSVYHAFSDLNVSTDIVYDPTLPIIVGSDFNVDPMCWVLCHMKDGKLLVFDEIVLRNTNTQKTLDHLNNRYNTHLAGWHFFGDAASKAKHTSASITDYLTIRNDARFGQVKVIYPDKNPRVRVRYSLVNSLLRSASGDIRTYINPRCKRLLNDFGIMSYVEYTTDVEDYKGTDIGHMSDALGYIVCQLFPPTITNRSAPAVWSR